MKISSATQMKEIDQSAINNFGIPEIALMENAGHEIAQEAIKICKAKQKAIEIERLNFCIVAGCGNNGGDGFVAARHLLNAKAKVKIFLIGNTEHFSPSAKINYDILTNMHAEIYHIVSERDWNRLQIAITFSNCIIDALLGTGFHGTLREETKKCIDILNTSNRPILAVDIPSGVNADNGVVESTAVSATATITFGLPKIGLINYPGSEYVGKIIVKTIGLPNSLLEIDTIKQEAIDKDFVKKYLAKRADDVYKGSCGKVLVIAGSTGLTGAACLASSAVLRIGAGICTLASAESLYDILAIKNTEVMTMALPEISPGILGNSAKEKIKTLADSSDVLLIGPGLGRNDETCAMIRELATTIEKPLVLDADAIFAFSQAPDELKNIKKMPILTPHLGEMANLLHIEIKDLKDNLWDIARKAAEYFNAIFVIKSEKTIVAYPDGNIFVTTVGNSGMATAGCGDVLAGTIAGLLAENLAQNMTAPVGVYLHGLAGDIASQNGRAGLVASDILKSLPKARQQIDLK